MSRAEVRADLVRLEHAGYRPTGSDLSYPLDIKVAGAKVAAQDHSSEASSIGGAPMIRASPSDVPLAPNYAESTYGHH